jgi:thiol-disulfide isomerase/thioredoxin
MQSKLLLLDFRADWCKPCIDMERTTFQDKDLADFLSSRYLPLKVDVDYSSGKSLGNKFMVNQYPTLLVIDPSNEKVIMRLIGFKTASILIGDLRMLEPKDNKSVKLLPSSIENTNDSDNNAATTDKKKCFVKRWFQRLGF